LISQEIIRGLSIALDDFGETPIIVRSSSLLEDRFGAAFSGKYKSLFLANQGSKKERLNALTDAIAEVYASTFSPDPIAYRSEMGLLDFNEKMGIMIQEVVGTKIGNYYLPSFAGVAFSNNEFRWSSRIKQKDGLIRMVPGLGTRAVDRISEDYPVLIAPAKADLRVNVTPDEIIRYSPKNIDIINLDTNSLETVEIKWFIEKFGNQIPEIQNIVSVVNGDLIRKPTSLFNIDFEKDELLVTFEGLLQKTDFIKNINNMLKFLEDKLGTPVDIEFAHDGSNFYLLQCRPQSYSQNIQPAPIPKDIQENKIAFSANRYISNGYIQDITHIVYVDPDAYSLLSSISELKNVGYAVGKLNKILPKRQFILMGPGRWGSRGDIKLGVNVTYSDINNCAALIEIAKKKGNYVPELSFGTHFFQDLVEASIHYLPLYPDEKGIIFNEVFFTKSDNMLSELLPEFADLDSVIRVIDVAHSANGSSLHILMNAELDEAIGIFEDSKKKIIKTSKREISQTRYSDDYWIWRLNMANRIASQLDPKRFGVKGFYVFGSTKNATAGPGSDIDILIHFIGTDTQKKELLLWLDGWGLSLAEVNFKRTGYKSTNLLDIHLVTNQDIEKKNSYATKIGAVTDAAKPLKMGTSISK
jgi:predicted nucleotidyltransferase